MGKIGFDYNELNEIDLDWIEVGLRQMLEIFEGMDKNDMNVQKAIREIKNTQRKLENLRNSKY